MPLLYQMDKVSTRNFFPFLDIYRMDKSGQDARMTIEEIRRENARALASLAGGRGIFAEQVELSESRVSQLIGINPTKNIGRSTARRIEQAFNKPVGWLDVLHGEPLNVQTLGGRLREVMEELGIDSPKALADFCDVSEGLVSQWFSGQTKLGPKPLRALGRTQFNLDWLADGSLPKYREGHDQAAPVAPPVLVSQRAVQPDLDDLVRPEEIAELIMLFGKADQEGRQMIMDLARGAVEVDQEARDRHTGDKS